MSIRPVTQALSTSRELDSFTAWVSGWHLSSIDVRMERRPVLVVDDDPDSHALMAHVLAIEGYAVSTAANGSDALCCLPSCRPFVIVLDMDMPVMDGRSFRLHQKQLARELALIPVIVCSGSEALDAIASELQPLACLSKPLPDFGRTATACPPPFTT